MKNICIALTIICTALLIAVVRDVQISNWVTQNDITSKDWFTLIGAAILSMTGFFFVKIMESRNSAAHKKKMHEVLTALLTEIRIQSFLAIHQMHEVFDIIRNGEEFPDESMRDVNVVRLIQLKDQDLIDVIENPKHYVEIISMAEMINKFHQRYIDLVFKTHNNRRETSSTLLEKNLTLLGNHEKNLQQMINACNLFLGEPAEKELQTKPYES